LFHGEGDARVWFKVSAVAALVSLLGAVLFVAAVFGFMLTPTFENIRAAKYDIVMAANWFLASLGMFLLAHLADVRVRVLHESNPTRATQSQDR